MKEWIPKLFFKRSDGGKDSGVTGYFLVEWKKFFSIVLLRFSEGSRNTYHSHAFDAITWWLSGEVEEETYQGETLTFKPSFRPKLTKRDKVHKVKGVKTTWAISFRNCWTDTWFEIDKEGNKIILTHGRKVIND
jgi:predicted metal-dependent enzyme (double-stranded beta helix superfamily)